jgi:hypothetical protein
MIYIITFAVGVVERLAKPLPLELLWFFCARDVVKARMALSNCSPSGIGGEFASQTLHVGRAHSYRFMWINLPAIEK